MTSLDAPSASQHRAVTGEELWRGWDQALRALSLEETRFRAFRALTRRMAMSRQRDATTHAARAGSFAKVIALVRYRIAIG